MTGAFPNLFKHITVGPFTLKNRIAVSPHGPMYGKGGLLTKRYADYEIEKAKGGAGLIIMSYGLSDPDTPPDPAWGNWSALVSTWKRENIPFFRDVVQAAHDHGCRVLFQYGENAYTTGMAPTAFPHTGITSMWSREMTRTDIEALMGKYAHCAEVLMEAGLDGVEMHGHGDFFSDFFSPAMNRRRDEYGGALENRVRFFLEAADAIRGVIGRDKALGARLSVDDRLPGSLPLQEGVSVARTVAEAGLLDYLNIDTVSEPHLLQWMIAPMYAPQGYELYAAEAVKAAVGNIPIFAVGRITEPAFADQIIAEGRADVVTMARALIADPEWPNKVKEGRADDIRPCLGDNQECMGRISQGLPMACTVNPAAGHEGAWGIGKIKPAERRKKVLVVGGGPAGMEAARMAAQRGHDVSLHERSDGLGGQVRLAQMLPGRADIGRFLPWHRRQLESLGVKVKLGSAVTPETIDREAPDAVVLATGARWDKSGFNGVTFAATPGWEQPNVHSLTDVVGGAATLGARVVIVDLKGFVEAPGLAELLAGEGKTVEIVTPFPKLGSFELDFTLQWPHVMGRVLSAGVIITQDTAVESIDGRTVNAINVHSGQKRAIEADDVVIISGRNPDTSLYDALASRGVELHRVGDCESPHNIGKGFRDAWRVAVAL